MKSPLDGVRADLGEPPRKLGWLTAPPISFPKPDWAGSVKDDPLMEVFNLFKAIHRKGVVVWGWLVRANREMYEAGLDDCPGTVLYSLRDPDEITSATLPQLGARLRELAGTDFPPASWSPRERDLADDLHDDMSYHGGFRLPEHWIPHDREYRVSSILFHRAHLKDGRLTSRLLPLLVLPESPYMPVVIPCSYWTPDIEEAMAQNGREKSVPQDPRELREHFYSEVLGPITSVFHETEFRTPHIDVYLFGPREPFEHFLYLTGGLSDTELLSPERPEHVRTEVAFYSTVRSTELANLARNLAHYPVESGRSLGHGDTMTLGKEGEAALGTHRFPHLLFLAALRADDRRLGGLIKIDGLPVYPFMAVPVTEREFSFIQENGVSEFLAEVGRSPVSIIFDPQRQEVV